MVCKNRSRRLGRACFSKLGWQANVIWRIALSIYLPLGASTVRLDDLIRGSLRYRPPRVEQKLAIAFHAGNRQWDRLDDLPVRLKRLC
jgi:hypothetical protein